MNLAILVVDDSGTKKACGVQATRANALDEKGYIRLRERSAGGKSLNRQPKFKYPRSRQNVA